MSSRLPEELIDLLVSDSTEGLDTESADSLVRMLGDHPDDVRESFEHAAAIAHLALLDGAPSARAGMPPKARDRLLGAVRAAGNDPHRMQAPAVEPPPGNAPATVVPTVRRSSGFTGWLVAAAIALAWGTSFVLQEDLLPLSGGSSIEVDVPIAQVPPTHAQKRASLLAEATDVITVPWNQSADALAQVSGDVVWSNERQEGYMRLAGMPANDPSAAQYQLWIVDPERDAEPVDGGVFDVADSAGGEVIIPIEAKLGVIAPAAFAITEEQPGGVVVSEGPLILVAGL
ncbi:MAG: anti-sigma factor [Pseudomonadota bacterium]